MRGSAIRRAPGDVLGMQAQARLLLLILSHFVELGRKGLDGERIPIQNTIVAHLIIDTILVGAKGLRVLFVLRRDTWVKALSLINRVRALIFHLLFEL